MSDIRLSEMDRIVRRPRPYVKYVTIGTIAAISVAAVYFLMPFAFTRTASADRDRIVFSTVRNGVFIDSIPITGNIVPIDIIYLDAIEGGKVVTVHVEEGDRVVKGEPLVTLENTNLQLETIGREAQLTEQINNLLLTELAIEQNRLNYQRDLIEIDYQLQLLELRLARLRSTQDVGSVTEEELDNAKIEYQYYKNLRKAVREAQSIDELSQENRRRQLKTAVENMTENLDIASKNLQELVIRAPISGELTMLDANIGQSLPRGSRVGQIDEIDQYKVSALVDEFYLGRLVRGQVANVDINGDELTLKVTKIYPEVRARQFEIDLSFENKPDSARFGQTLRMTLKIGEPRQGRLIDYGAFYEDTGGRWVYVVGSEDKTATKRVVTLGRQNRKHVEVIDGLQDGERVIVSGYGSFGDVETIVMQ